MSDLRNEMKKVKRKKFYNFCSDVQSAYAITPYCLKKLGQNKDYCQKETKQNIIARLRTKLRSKQRIMLMEKRPF